MAKNPFKKQSLTDTLVNVGIGGAANVALDYVLDMVDPAGTMLSGTTKNIVKIVGGALVGGMVGSKMLRAATDGIAVVGVSNLISELMGDTTSESTTTEPTAGLAPGTIGRVRTGDPYFKKKAKKNGFSIAGSFISK